MPVVSLYNCLKVNTPGLFKALRPLANVYANVSGHRQMGLKYDDLLIEENETVQKALGRLSPRQEYDRAWRLRRASHYSILHTDLPKEQQIKPEQDDRYLIHLVEQVKREEAERAAWDNVEVSKK